MYSSKVTHRFSLWNLGSCATFALWRTRGDSAALRSVFTFRSRRSRKGFESWRMNLVRGCSIAWDARCGSPNLDAHSCHAFAACCAKSNPPAEMSRSAKLQLVAPFAWA